MTLKRASNKFTLHMAMVVLAAALGGILYGYDIGVMSMAVLYIQDSMALTSVQLEIVVGTVFVGGILGSLAVGYLADRYGRKTSIVLACVFFLLGTWIVQWADSFTPLFLARLCLGIGVGFISVIIPLYTAELAVAHNRGRFITLFQLSLTIGILLSYLIDYFLATGHHWRGMFAVIFVPSMVLLSLTLFLPETPRWLFFHKNPQAAAKAMHFLHGHASAQQELASIDRDYRHQVKKQRMKLPIQLMAFVLLLAACNQLIGVNAVLQYAPFLLKSIGGSTSQLDGLGTVSVGFMNVMFTIIAFALVDFLGRKPLLIIGISGVIIANIFLAAISLSGLSPALKAQWYLSGLLLYIASFAIGPGVVIWLMMSELLPTSIRSKGMAIALLGNSLASVATTSTFLSLMNHWGLVGIHASFTVAAIVYLIAVGYGLPETKNTILEKIQVYRKKKDVMEEYAG